MNDDFFHEKSAAATKNLIELTIIKENEKMENFLSKKN
jgi:hypothetical protein